MSSKPEDIGFMQEALSLARTNLGHVWPNPAVGCVIVKEGHVVGRGCTQPGGRPHAEVVALEDAAEQAFEATAYVTLEPCNHWGETPPCADALIDAGVSRVVVALNDPDERVNGQGIAHLQDAGLDIDVGVCAEEARDVNAGFFHRIDTGRPLINVLDPDELRMGDLFYGATFFDAILMDLDYWLTSTAPQGDASLYVILDDTAVTPASLGKKSKAARESIWLIVPRGRSPGRVQTMQHYVGNILEADIFEGGHVDMEALLTTLGQQGLTRVGVAENSDMAERLKAAHLV